MIGSHLVLGMANALDGMDRGQAARQAGMDRQTLRDWVIRFNAEGVEGPRDRPKSGWPPVTAWLSSPSITCMAAALAMGSTSATPATRSGRTAPNR